MRLNWILRKELWIKGYYFFQEKGFSDALKRFWILFQEKGIENKGIGIDNEARYRKWWKSQELSKDKIDKIKKKIQSFEYKPIVSILVPVYNTPSKWLEECLESVANQIYPNWELCIVDDNSSSEETRKVLNEWIEKSKEDKRIKIKFSDKNQHISLATNECLKLAEGEYIGLLDHDDTLHPLALYFNVKSLNKDPKIDFLYSDEDKIDSRGQHCYPNFKSDWNPDLLLSTNYICHFAVIRRKLVEELGGMRKGYEGSQDYDLFLRISEKTSKIFHITHVLYHWRSAPGSTALTYHSKNYAVDTSFKALRDAAKRRDDLFEVKKGIATCSYRAKYPIVNNPGVSIIIPFKDKPKVLKKCLDSILEKTDYSNYEIILVNNKSEEEKTKKYLEEIKENSKISIFDYEKPFNFSSINNWAVDKAKNEYILFLNNDTEVINKNWLKAMLEHIQRKEVGVVGAKLLYPNGRIQHAGLILGIGRFKEMPFGIAENSHKNFPKGSNGYFEQINLIRDCSAVSAACMLTKKSLFKKLEGFDEEKFGVAWNDVDYCLKIRKENLLIVYTPFSQLYHYESLSRGSDFSKEKRNRFHKESDNMFQKWMKELGNDPYYNPNLSLEDESFRVRTEAKTIY